MSDPAVIPVPAKPVPEWRQYLRFAWNAFSQSVEGGWKFYVWMTLLTAVFLVGANAWAVQVRDGMALTAMSDHVSWGLYIANFTFLVGLAAGGVMMVIPAYLYHDEQMHDIVIIGELLAIAAILVCVGFIAVDMGRPDRMWHVLPGLGRLNWPISMLSWDVIVLNGYLLLNLHICGYLVYMKYLGRRPHKRWYLPFVFLSIGWAISIHSVTAFLYAGLGGRPFWNSALLAPRFIVSAFITGPAFVILLLYAIKRFAQSFYVASGPIDLLARVLRITILVNLFMFGSEVFTELYSGADLEHVGVLGHHGDLGRAQRRIVLVLLDADVLFQIPGRHHAGMRSDTGALLDRPRPRTHIFIRDERHRTTTTRTMAVLAAALKDGSDVLGERHFIRDRSRCRLQRERRHACHERCRRYRRSPESPP